MKRFGAHRHPMVGPRVAAHGPVQVARAHDHPGASRLRRRLEQAGQFLGEIVAVMGSRRLPAPLLR